MKNYRNIYTKLTSKGDTIIEVLIAITIISTVLAGAFVSANRSLATTRQAQERGEALKVTEAHLERFKVAATKPAIDVFTKTNFCIGTTPLALIAITNINDFTTYPAGCVIAPQGGLKYFILVERSIETFTLSTRWDSLVGVPKEQVQLYYRVYP